MNDFLICNSLQKYWPNCSVDFSCSVPKGKTLVLFGHSGSGKSTVLQMISGLLNQIILIQKKILQRFISMEKIVQK